MHGVQVTTLAPSAVPEWARDQGALAIGAEGVCVHTGDHALLAPWDLVFGVHREPRERGARLWIFVRRPGGEPPWLRVTLDDSDGRLEEARVREKLGGSVGGAYRERPAKSFARGVLSRLTIDALRLGEIPRGSLRWEHPVPTLELRTLSSRIIVRLVKWAFGALVTMMFAVMPIVFLASTQANDRWVYAALIAVVVVGAALAELGVLTIFPRRGRPDEYSVILMPEGIGVVPLRRRRPGWPTGLDWGSVELEAAVDVLYLSSTDRFHHSFECDPDTLPAPAAKALLEGYRDRYAQRA